MHAVGGLQSIWPMTYIWPSQSVDLVRPAGRYGPPPWRATSYPRGVGLPTVRRYSLGLQKYDGNVGGSGIPSM